MDRNLYRIFNGEVVFTFDNIDCIHDKERGPLKVSFIKLRINSC